MSYLRSIEKFCQNCGRRATVELFGMRNQSYGPYCKRCGEKRETELKAEEKDSQ